jgi:transposase
MEMLRGDGETTKYPEDLLDRGVRLVFESGRPIAHVAKDLGISSEVLHKRVRQAEADNGTRPDLPTSAEREEIRKLRREVYELRRGGRECNCMPVSTAASLSVKQPARDTGARLSVEE